MIKTFLENSVNEIVNVALLLVLYYGKKVIDFKFKKKRIRIH